ncbi:hypothetical protein D3C85_1240740 [compost metagenome]
MGHDEIGVRERDVHDHIAEKQPGQTADQEGDDKGQGKQHRHGQVDVAAPQGQYPVIDFQRRRHRNDQSSDGEEKAKVRVHSADIHMVRPDHKTEYANRNNGPHHHSVAEDIFTRMGTDQVGDQTKRRESDDVDLRVAEEPEQVLEQYRAATLVIELLPQRDHRRHEEAGAQQLVEQHHDRTDEQRREGQQGHDRGHEDAPYRERHAKQGHAVRARLQHRGDVVQPAHGGGDNKNRQ